MNKKYKVSVSYVVEVDAQDDSDAVNSARYVSLLSGGDKIRHLAFKVVVPKPATEPVTVSNDPEPPLPAAAIPDDSPAF